MNKPLKVFLWVLAAIGLLVVVGIGLLGYFGYPLMKKYATEYNCTTYNETLHNFTIRDITEESGPGAVQRLAIRMTIFNLTMFTDLWFLDPLDPDTGQETHLENPEDAIKAVNQMSSMCRTYPNLSMDEIFDSRIPLNDRAERLKAHETLIRLNAKVSYTTDASSTLLANSLSEYARYSAQQKKLTKSSNTTPAAQ